jgi:hypothetical protein
MGRLQSFVMLSQVDGKPGTTIEWARENFNVLEELSQRRDVFPSPPGVYFIDVTTLPDDGRKVPGQFMVDPVLSAINEPLILFGSSGDTEAQLARDGIYPGSVRLWLGGRQMLVRGTDYEVDEATGAITFLKPTPTGYTVHADYRYGGGQQGPHYFQRDEFNIDAIPGVVLAFGDRCQEGDSMAVVVTDERTDVAEVYGGKFEVAFDLVAFVRNDAEDRERLSDYIVHSFLNIQNRLGFEGLELLDISPGGEDEEIYNEVDNTYYYDSSISLSLRVDWETWLALPVVVNRIELTSRQQEQEHGWLDGSAPADLLQAVLSFKGIVPVQVGKTFERII